MGYICHHTIIVTSYDEKMVAEAHAKAEELFAKKALDQEFRPKGTLVSPILKGLTNGYASFFVAPDGSKEGWEPSDKGDKAREDFVAYLRSQAYEDGSSSLDYAEVQFGDEDLQTVILNSSNDDYKKAIDADEATEEEE